MAKNLQYEGVKPEAFEQLKGKLRTYGIDLKENKGSFSEKGVSGSYNYDPQTEVLRLDDLSVGFPASMMVSLDSLQNRMNELMVQHGARPL
ncbi:hypothetical protein CLV24_104204 [Pontibacter ummariensis]|uniref:Uncharacterized protein n=1 Tax=Pontibacter ummariensis TaxID=1610492 RepID=A0A239DF00_9BACT|nr:hypothetical protein [Pontibacter ummariensis]PRY14393.1 hypothetical protein CLV24_104204 [Pontibacter ummariensis]SNS30930.1 hypothetical protein SAMN06296052_104203 [Pontibacter ummariensis]